METKQQKSKEYAQTNYKTEIWQKEAVKCYEAGWKAAMEYLYKMQPTDAWKEIIKEVKGE